jgi:aminopeptidase N
VAAGILATGCTEAEAKTRAGLIDVGSYAVFLDLATDPGTVRSRAEIRFRCRQPGAATFADLHASAVNRVTCNGKGLDPAAALSDGRLHRPGLAAGNVLTVDAELGYSPAGRGLTRFADPADGVDYALGYGYPTSAPSMFCCFDQPDLRADMTLTVSTPAGWECVANGVVTDRPAKGEAGTWRFATVPAMKTYDLAVCAGPYVTSSDQDYRGAGGAVRISVRTRRTLAGSSGLTRVGGVVRQALAACERTLGVACPYRRPHHLVTRPLKPPLSWGQRTR